MSDTRVSLRRRLAAWFALAGTVALAVTLAVILFNHGVSILIGIVGLFLAVAGGWWLVTEPMPRRAIGIAGLAAGFALDGRSAGKRARGCRPNSVPIGAHRRAARGHTRFRTRCDAA